MILKFETLPHPARRFPHTQPIFIVSTTANFIQKQPKHFPVARFTHKSTPWCLCLTLQHLAAHPTPASLSPLLRQRTFCLMLVELMPSCTKSQNHRLSNLLQFIGTNHITKDHTVTVGHQMYDPAHHSIFILLPVCRDEGYVTPATWKSSKGDGRKSPTGPPASEKSNPFLNKASQSSSCMTAGVHH